MTTLTSFFKTDLVDDHKAEDVNNLIAAAFRSEYKNVETLSATRTLEDSDTPIQRYECGAADRIVKLPTADSVDNHPFFVVNASAAARTISLQNNAGSSTLASISQGHGAIALPDGAGDYLVVGTEYLLKSGLSEWDEQGSDPSTPGTGKWKLYFKSGGLYLVDDAGTVTGPLGTGGGGGGDKYPMEFRLTLTSGTPVTTVDVTTATTIYLCPFNGNQIALYSGGAWSTLTSAEMSLALGTITSGLPYDIFCYNNSGTATLEKLAWTSATARATALATQDGVLVKSGDATRRYIGTIGAISSSQTADSTARRMVWNYYNRVQKNLVALDLTNSWTYTTATWRAQNANTTDGEGRVSAVVGVAEDAIAAINHGLSSSSSGPWAAVGIGINSTSTNSAQIIGGVPSATGATFDAYYSGVLPIGYNSIQRLEISQATGTTYWYGDAGFAYVQSGLYALVRC